MATDRKEPLRLIVDSEVFDVVPDAHQPNACHYNWTSGPNRDYGFSSFPSGGYEFTPADHEAAIRDFLSSINPETGYLD